MMKFRQSTTREEVRRESIHSTQQAPPQLRHLYDSLRERVAPLASSSRLVSDHVGLVGAA